MTTRALILSFWMTRLLQHCEMSTCIEECRRGNPTAIIDNTLLYNVHGNKHHVLEKYSTRWTLELYKSLSLSDVSQWIQLVSYSEVGETMSIICWSCESDSRWREALLQPWTLCDLMRSHGDADDVGGPEDDDENERGCQSKHKHEPAQLPLFRRCIVQEILQYGPPALEARDIQ